MKREVTASLATVDVRWGRWRRWEWLALSAIVLVAAVVRFWHVGQQSLWYDEGWSIHVARQPISVALSLLASEGHTHPPGYYALLWLWTRMFGDGAVGVRGLSAVIGVLTVPLLYVTARELFDPLAGILAAVLLALSTSHVVYSQEARMYTLLAFATAGMVWQGYRCAGTGEVEGKSWLFLTLWEALAIYTHFFAALVIVPLDLWLLVRILSQARKGDRRAVAPWVISQIGVLVAFLPWLGPAMARAVSHTTMSESAPSMQSYWRAIWGFVIGGHLALEGRDPRFWLACVILAGCLALLLVIALVLELTADRVVEPRAAERIRAAGYLAFLTILPLALLYVVMLVKPGFHPRYALHLLVPLVLLAAWALSVLYRRSWAHRLVAALVCAAWLAASGIAAQSLVSDSYYDKDDARSIVSFLEETLGSGGLVFVDQDGWELRYYLDDALLNGVFLNVAESPDDLARSVMQLASAQDRVCLVRWHQGTTDHVGLLPYALERVGTLDHVTHLSGYVIYTYGIDDVPADTTTYEPGVRFGPLSLESATVQVGAPADEAIAICLRWELSALVESDLQVALDLVDHRGRLVVRETDTVLDKQGRGTADWAVGQVVEYYHRLDLMPGLAPLDYSLSVGVYDQGALADLDLLDQAGAPAGKRYELASVTLDPASGRGSKHVSREKLGLDLLDEPRAVAEGLTLLSFGQIPDSVSRGGPVGVLLEWRSDADVALPDYWPELRLVRDGLVVAATEHGPVDDLYPTSWWQPGETVLDWWSLMVPPEIESGDAQLEICVRGNEPVVLQHVEVEQVVRVFQPPSPQYAVSMSLGDVAELVGYDLDAEVLAPGQELGLTLYWRAIDPSDQPLTVFTHILTGDGRLVAQHDASPAWGHRPTTGWVPGEYIIDKHTLQWTESDESYTGDAMLEVGLYNPVTGERLLNHQGEGQLLLPSVLVVR